MAYCRVSSADQRDELRRQAGRVATGRGWRGIGLDSTVTEVGSELNGSQPKSHRLLSDPRVMLLVVEHRDRLARFGVKPLEAALSAHHSSLLVLNADEVMPR